jgi:hypothetical protein
MASTSFIDLTNRLLRRLNEVEIEQSDFASARGVHAMAKDAINASVEHINQAEFTWPFNASGGSQLLVVAQEHYDWPSDFKVPNWRSFFIVKDVGLNENGHLLGFISRDQYLQGFKQEDDYSGSDGVGTPMYVFEKHGNGFGITPSPDQAYTVTYEYWVNNTAMVAHDDTSTIPTNYDECIIQGALYHFYMFRDNSEQAQLAEKRFESQLSDMRTLMINKDDRVIGATEYTRVGRSSRGVPAIPIDGWYW